MLDEHRHFLSLLPDPLGHEQVPAATSFPETLAKINPAPCPHHVSHHLIRATGK